MNLPLFVYGTLMAGGEQGVLLAGLARRPASTTGKLFRMPQGYPALVPGTSGEIAGELVDDPGGRLGLLDRVEGVAEGLYQRAVLPVVVGGKRTEAWAYIMPDAASRGGIPIRSGRWRR